MHTVVLASFNPKKLHEMKDLLAPLDWQVRLISEFTSEVPEETASSFVENALLKARHAAAASGLPAIADDSGLQVDALRGAPGICSARYAADSLGRASDAANNAKLLMALKGVPDDHRGARFVCVFVMLRHAADPTPIIAQGLWRGRIVHEPVGINGFGYDPLFFVPEQGCTSAQLDPTLKNRVSHRGQAAASLLAALATEAGA